MVTSVAEPRTAQQQDASRSTSEVHRSNDHDEDDNDNDNDEDEDAKPTSQSPASKRTQTCFRCRQSKVKCVFDDNDPSSCRRCRRLAVTCELQGKKEPLSWQMRVQHQLATLEGTLLTFLEKQSSSSTSEPPQHPHLVRMRDSYPSTPGDSSGRSAGSAGGVYFDATTGPSSRKRRRLHPSDTATATATLTAGSPLSYQSQYGETSVGGYPASFSPRYANAERSHHHNGAEVLHSFATQSQGYGETPRGKSSSATAVVEEATVNEENHGAFSASNPNEDEHDQASRPLGAIQKLRMSVLDRKKDVIRSSERVFPNLYQLATIDVGSKDPRPNVIKQHLVSPSDAVVLFRFYAEYLDQYSFGFPTYRPDAIMSPMILSSVVAVASLHHAQLNTIHTPLKMDLMARLQTDDPSFPCSDVYDTLFSSSITRSSQSHLFNSNNSSLQFEKELDPELGIGVEEIVGASLFATWFGGKRAWMASRLARWWSAKFLRQQQHPAMMTMGEIMSILPPPRDLGKQDLLRVWLSAYVTEIHQACMEGTPSIAGLSSPFAVCDSLQYSRGLSQRTTLRDRILILHSKIAWIVSKAYHIAGSGSSDWTKPNSSSAVQASANAAGSTASGNGSAVNANRKSSPAQQCHSCRDGARASHQHGGGSSRRSTAHMTTESPLSDASACLQSILDAFEDLDSCQEEMAGKLDANVAGEPENMLYLDLFLARVLIASIGCDFLDSTLWDGSLGQLSSSGPQLSSIGRGNSAIEAELQDLRNRALRESLTRGVEAAMRSLELVCFPSSSASIDSTVSGTDTPINLLVLPLWFHWALSRSVLFLMNMLAEYPERLLPRDRTRSADLIHTFIDFYSKHIGHANMVLSHGAAQRASRTGRQSQSHTWSPSHDEAGDHLGSVSQPDLGNSRQSNRNSTSVAAASSSVTSSNDIPTSGGSATDTTAPSSANWYTTSHHHNANDLQPDISLQHPATPLLDTLQQCITWARHGAVL